MCYNYYKILVLTIILIFLSQMLAKSQNKFQPRILNGQTCKTTQVPFFVIIRHKFSCGASLITYSWTLTAAHCIIPEFFWTDDSYLGTVHSGHDMPKELQQVRIIKEFHLHPKYNQEAVKNGSDFTGDIGLVSVTEPFHETAATKLATLAAPGYTEKCNRVMVVGTGDTFQNEIWPKAVEHRPLMCVSVSLVDSDTCKKNISQVKTVKSFDTTHFICTYGPHSKEGACGGDSGAPLICDHVVIGTVSGSSDCVAPRRLMDFYSKVESYLDFINDVVKFTSISIKYGRTNGTNGQKPSDKSPANANINGTNVRGKKAPDKSSGNIVHGRATNWMLVLFTLFYFLLLSR